MRNICNNRKGTTLVEILVVMLILLVGIMVVIQMFPLGFSVLRAAENQTIATKLAQAEIERWKSMPGNLPDGILPILVNYADAPAGNDIQSNQEPGPPFHDFFATSDPNQFDAGNVLNFRFVINEIATLPIASYFSTGAGAVYGSRYVLAFSPIEAFIDPDYPDLYIGLIVKSGDLQRRRASAESDTPYLRAGQYAIDYTIGAGTLGADNTQPNRSGQPVFYVAVPDTNPDHIYCISYSCWINNPSTGDTQYVSRTNVEFSPRANGEWQEVLVDLPEDYEVEEIEASSDSCARMFKRVNGSSWSSDDPYEYALADYVMGVLAFNPYARNMTEYTARGVRAITARIDYRIYDPRIIREDKAVPELNDDPNNTGTNDHIAIKLALKFILNAGDPGVIGDGDATDNPDEPTFEGLVRQNLGKVASSANDLLVKDSMLIIDLATGLRVSMANVGIDFKAGVVHLPENANLVDLNGNTISSNIPLVGRHLRFFYRADGDWSVQCHKAYSNYARQYDNTTDLNFCHFRLIAPAGDGLNKLLFARCDAGKNVTVDYTYIDSSGNPHKVVGKTCQISDTYTSDTVGGEKPFLILDVPTGAYIDQNSRVVVVGSSFKARVIWRDGKHWRFVDVDTNLTRSSTP